jgi:hypothetical protein
VGRAFPGRRRPALHRRRRPRFALFRRDKSNSQFALPSGSAAHHPITMFDSIALRACSRSEPVSCM